MKRLSTLLMLLVGFLIISACSTQKSRSDVSKLKKGYHDMNARYNGYFNANELYQASLLSLEESHQDNYNKILDIYKYSAVENVQSVTPDLDNAIKKVSIVVSLHRVSHWVDDCYLLMAKSQYLKQDYESAEETLEYMVDEFNPKNVDKRKKKVNRSKKSKSERAKAQKEKQKESKKKKAEREKTQKEKRKEAAKAKKQREKDRKKRVKQSKKNKKNRAGAKKKTTTNTTPEKVEKVEKPTTVVEDEKKEEEKNKVDKKSEEDPGNYFLKHKPAYQEGVLWLARTYIQRDKFENASRLINKLKNDPKTFEEITAQLAAVEADFFLKQKKYAQSIAPLNQAVELTKNKKEKARYSFIVAQIYQKEGDGGQAYAFFEKALKYSPDYEMQFTSRLNMAQNAYVTGNATPEQAIKTLEKMLKDDKNKEYEDRIHFALAKIYLKNNNKSEAIASLRESLSNPQSSSVQKVESYLLLAELYYQDESYVLSKNYYDSTLMVMPKMDHRFVEAQQYANTLTEIATNIQIIELQDSLLAIAELSAEDKRKLAAKIKKEKIASIPTENNPAESLKEQLKNRTQIGRPGGNPRSGGEPSTWFAYDDRAVKKGKKNFEKQWGNRQLEDDWRRSSRRGAGTINDQIVEVLEDTGGDLSDKEMEEIFKDVPKTEAEKNQVGGKVKDAMFTLGTLYRDRLENFQRSVDILEQLENRFPGNSHELNAWYYQYLDHTDLSNKADAKRYLDKILKKYAESTYAKVLKDPNYLKTLLDEEQKLNNYYEDTYSDFVDGDFQRAYDKVGRVEELFGSKNTLQPKFALLNAMLLGNIKGREDYVKSLKEVVAKFPDTAEQKRAKEILRLLGELKDDSRLPQEGGVEGRFKLQDEKVHYMIVVLDGTKIKLGEAKIAVSDYNREFHKNDKLRISNIYLGADTDTPILVIRRFKDKELALKYHKGIMNNKKKFLGDNDDYEIFAVTQHNYREILKSKSLDGYRSFFEENYLK